MRAVHTPRSVGAPPFSTLFLPDDPSTALVAVLDAALAANAANASGLPPPVRAHPPVAAVAAPAAPTAPAAWLDALLIDGAAESEDWSVPPPPLRPQVAPGVLAAAPADASASSMSSGPGGSGGGGRDGGGSGRGGSPSRHPTLEELLRGTDGGTSDGHRGVPPSSRDGMAWVETSPFADEDAPPLCPSPTDGASVATGAASEGAATSAAGGWTDPAVATVAAAAAAASEAAVAEAAVAAETASAKAAETASAEVAHAAAWPLSPMIPAFLAEWTPRPRPAPLPPAGRRLPAAVGQAGLAPGAPAPVPPPHPPPVPPQAPTRYRGMAPAVAVLTAAPPPPAFPAAAAHHPYPLLARSPAPPPPPPSAAVRVAAARRRLAILAGTATETGRPLRGRRRRHPKPPDRMTQDVAVLEAVAGSLVSIAGEAVAERRRLLAERQSLVRVLRDMGGAPPPAGAHPAWAAGGEAAGAGCRWGAARGWPRG